MNPVRAGIVKEPDSYYFSSYGAKTGSREIKWLDYDSSYLALGKTENERQKEYQRWFHESIPEDEWNLIREAIQRNWAYSNNRFKKEVESIVGRRFETKKVGRKPKI